MTNRSSVAPADRKSRLSTDQVVLWVQFLVGAGSSHTKDFKNGSGPCLHGTYKSPQNWSILFFSLSVTEAETGTADAWHSKCCRS